VAPTLLQRAVVEGRVITGDALYCQHTLLEQIRQAGGDYLVAIKANQPELFGEVALVFTEPPPDLRWRTAHQTDLHGGRLETRTLRATTALNSYLAILGWPGVGQVLEVARMLRWPAKPERAPVHEVRYFLTSLPAAEPAAHLLDLVRGHWRIENQLHYVRDVTLGEDASQVRSGSAPQVLAALRNCALGLLRQDGVTNLAARLRHHAWQPAHVVLRLLGISLSGSLNHPG
jgi:predicted transposase YbfD/YdcC